MVDATASFEGNAPARQTARMQHQAAKTVFSVQAADDEVLAAYADFCRSAVFGPAQSPGWVSAWTTATGTDCLIATLHADGRPVLALALEVRREGPFRIARFMGGKHANGNFPATDPTWHHNADDVFKLVDAIAKTRPDIDIVALERLLGDFDGMPNPLLALPHAPGPNVALAVNLDGGFDAVLDRASGKRKRKKNRSQTRKYDAVGGARCIQAATPAETDAMLDAFFAMKEQRFRAMGITDVFAAPEVRVFFKRLFAEALQSTPPPFVLHGLEAAGKFRAVTGASRAGSRLVCEFGAIADDELAYISPGDYLFFDNIAEASRQGFETYDFSVGDEPYKRFWCDLEIRHADVTLPLTAKGSALALGLRATARLKAFVKGNPLIWRFVRKFRKGTLGQAAPTEEQ